MFKKISLLIIIIFTVTAVFSLAAVSNVQAAGEHDNCTTSSDCDDGLSCRANPWFGNSNAPSNVNSGDDRICCNTSWGCIGESDIGNVTGLGSTDPREIAARVINVLLGFLGIIAVILILAGGFMWMTAAGNDDKVTTAKQVMASGAIGLVIVLAAFGIARFVISALLGATT